MRRVLILCRWVVQHYIFGKFYLRAYNIGTANQIPLFLLTNGAAGFQIPAEKLVKYNDKHETI